MKHSNLEAAQSCLQAAHAALIEELKVTDSYALHDAETLTADALSQVRGEIKARLPEYPVLDRRTA
jgi:hypothetical protein